MAQESPAQERKIHKVMHEFKEGKLHSGNSDKKVKSPKQAIAIAMSEAHADKPKSERSHGKKSQASHKAMNTREKEGK